MFVLVFIFLILVLNFMLFDIKKNLKFKGNSIIFFKFFLLYIIEIWYLIYVNIGKIVIFYV